MFKVGDDAALSDAAQLESVRLIVAQRLQAHPLTALFIVQAGQGNELVVFAPELTEAEIATVRDLVTRPGTLEFALLANTRDHAPLIAAAQSEATADPVAEQTDTAWIPLENNVDGRPIDLGDDGTIVTREVEQDGRSEKQVLVVFGAPQHRLTERLLSGAQRQRSHAGATALGFTWNEQGGYLMTLLTGHALPDADGFKRRLGIIMDGRLHSAPGIQDIVGDRGIIEGEFTEDDVLRMVICWNSGRLPLPVRFVEAERIDPK